MSESVLEAVDHGQGDELGVHGLQGGHAPKDAMVEEMGGQELRTMTEGWLEDAEMTNRDTVRQSVRDEIHKSLENIHLLSVQYLQPLCNDARRGFCNIVIEERGTAFFC